MRPMKLRALCLGLALLAAAPLQAAPSARSLEKTAEEAVREELAAITIWVDASWGFRNQGAANNLSRAHQVFALRGYKVVDVAPYVENGDLQGFFVTYQKP